jgi:acetyl esterase/lipase
MRRPLALLLTTLTAACSPLGLANGLLSDSGAVKVERDVAFGADPRQALDVYAPKGARKPALLLFFYGGSWNSGRRQDYGFIASALAARGYVTVVPDYRLVPQVRFPSFLEDGAKAVAWSKANAARLGADPNRIILIGHSAGAYNAAMLALDQRYGAADAIAGVVGLAGPYDFYPFDVRATVAAFGQAPDPQATQPVRFARADAPPFLLLTGSDDKTVRPRNSEALAKALEAAGAEVKLVRYDGVAHVGVLLAMARGFRGRAPVLDDVSTFVDSR